MCYYLISVQSWNDLGIGLIVSPLFSAVLASELAGSANCEVLFAFFITFFTMAGFSVAILSAMNLERYASIVHPIYHRTEVTKNKVLTFVFTICALFVCVSLVSFKLGLEIMRKFSGYVFLLHFVSTIYLYTRIFLAGKAKFQKKPQPRTNAVQGNLQPIGENNVAMHQRSSSCNQAHSSTTEDWFSNNQESHRGNQGSSSDDQGHSSITEKTLSGSRKEQFVSQGKQSNNKEDLSDSQGMQSNRPGKTPENQREQSNNQGEQLNNEGKQSNNQANQSDSHGKKSDNQGRQSDKRGKNPDNQTEHSDNQGEQLNNERKQSHYRAEQSNSQGGQSDNQDSGTNNQGRLANNQNRKSEKDVSKKLKLAKSCLFVVICSFIGFILPTVFQPLEVNDLHEIMLDGWFTLFVLSNSTLDSVIFFWRNKVLRNEAKKVLKNMFS